MKSLISKNSHAACYINFVMKTYVTLTFLNERSSDFEKLILDHGLLQLRPEPVSHEKILKEIEAMDREKEHDSVKYAQVLDLFHDYEFATENLGLFIDNYDCVSKILQNSANANKSISKFLVQNYISIGSLVSQNMMAESLKEKSGKDTEEKLSIILAKLLVCVPPNMETFNEEGIDIKLQHIVTNVTLAEDNKFIQFAEEMKEVLQKDS
ncbi:MAG: hypothetical protein CBC42_00920 [Betaproteobacteria bacterium TMED82]|nr:MAG: hypothetical protein CBC42_00920 [Betaproteobacteria bacterium TMED82]